MTFASRATTALILAGLATGTASAATVTAADDPVLYWNQVLITGLAGSPTLTSRGFAMVNVALHDAVNATLGSPNYGFLGPVATSGGDTRAAASVAARNVLAYLNPAKTAEFDAALATSLALIPDGIDKTNGIATGMTISAAAIANRMDDGLNAVVPYTPGGAPGGWVPTPAGFAPAALPQWAHMDPWLMSSVDQFRPGAPLALGSAEYAAAYNEVMAIGSLGSLSRSGDQTAAAQFWATPGASGTGPWVQAGIDASLVDGLSTIENATLFALLSTSVADAIIAVWDAKYHYDFWRPVTAIHGGGLDGNAATIADASWMPLIGTPAHQSYISGHSAVAASATTILGSIFGDDTPFCLASGLLNRCWASYSASAFDAANSRLWGGIHWGFDNEAGLIAGQQAAQFAIDGLAFDAVPEPASWALMIAGFGLLGAAIRRRAIPTYVSA